MTQHELEKLFAQTSGNITIRDNPETSFITSRDFDALSDFIESARCPMVDLVTDQGEAVGLVIHQKLTAHQLPLPTVGDVFLGDGKPLPGQVRDIHWAPCWQLHNLHSERHTLKGLHVKFASTEQPDLAGSWAEHLCLDDRSPDEAKHLLALNALCAVVFIANKLFIAWSAFKGGAMKFISVRDAQQREAGRLVEVKRNGEVKTLKMFDEWMRWQGRRQYDDVRFAPGSHDERTLNLFTGPAIDPGAGDWSSLREHIRLVICQGDEEHFIWYITYFAHLFQFPGEKPSTAIVISGNKGTGKSIFFDFLSDILGANFSKISDGKRALGNFNAQNETALFVLMEEAFWAADQGSESVLKDMITSPKQRIERKGVDAYMAPSFYRTALLSNAGWVVPASFDERRFAVFKCGDQHRGDIPYFKALAAQMNNGGKAAMLFDLLNYRPKNGWDVLRTPPVTRGLEEQIIASLRGVDRFMYELLSTGSYECDKCVEGGIFLDLTCPTSWGMTEVRAAARDYMVDNYPGHKAATVDMIDRAVREWFSARVEYRAHNKNSVRWVEFPPLSESREHVWRTKSIKIPAVSHGLS